MATRPPEIDPPTGPKRPSATAGLPDTAALPPGTRLSEFEILSVLGVGGFGIVYRAMDHALGREVAIKEYMPSALADRTETLHVSLRSAASADTFALGLRSFVNEARLLARFDHPALVKVYRFWEQHNTAYMVMPLYRGRTLKQLREAGEAAVDEASLRRLLSSLLGALERLHDEGVYHRDISPDNIVIEPDGRPVLLDFGAARHVIADRSQNLTAILKPSYAPIEQYAEADGLRQGAWTDLYALGATLHFLIRGIAPPPSTVRTLADPMKPLAHDAVPGVSGEFLAVVDWMLEPRPDLRPGSVASLRQVLSGKAPLPPRAGPAMAVASAAAASSTPLVASPQDTGDANGSADTVVIPRMPPSPAVADSTPPAASPPAASPRVAAPSASMPAAPIASSVPTGSARRPWGLAVAGLGTLGVVTALWFLLQPGGTSTPPGPATAPAIAAAPVAAPPLEAPSAAPAAPAVSTAPAPAPPGAAVTDATTATVAPPVDAPPATPRPAAPVVKAPAAPPPARPAPSASPSPAPSTAPAPAPSLAAAPAGAARPAAAAPTVDGSLSPPPKAPAAGPSPRPAEAQAAPKPLPGPREQCGSRVLVALWNCMNRQCARPELSAHPECKAWKESTEWHRGNQNP